MAKPMSSNLRVVTRSAGGTDPAKAEKTSVSFEELSKMTVAKTIVDELSFPVTCMHVRGSIVFAAQLANGDRFSVAPVMPRNPIDPTVILAPDNGEEGYLTLERSENTRVSRDATGKLEFSIRPKFIAWVSTDDRAAKEAKTE